MRVGQREGAVSAGRTAIVQERKDVRAAADVAQVALNTASQLHATVASSTHEDDVTTTVATDIDLLHVAELVNYQRRPCNTNDTSTVGRLHSLTTEVSYLYDYNIQYL